MVHDTMSEASKNALKRGMTPTHELMVDWMLENPGGTLREMGAFFNYSEGWLSTIMHSDAFKSYASERLQGVHCIVNQDIPARMRTLAEVAIERMQEVLEKTEDADVIKDSFDKVMNRYGYAPGSQKPNLLQGGGPVQNNLFFLSPQQFQKAQELLIQAHAPKELPSSPLPQQPAVEKLVTGEEETLPSGK